MKVCVTTELGNIKKTTVVEVNENSQNAGRDFDEMREILKSLGVLEAVPLDIAKALGIDNKELAENMASKSDA